jgi:hypothetical protein
MVRRISLRNPLLAEMIGIGAQQLQGSSWSVCWVWVQLESVL